MRHWILTTTLLLLHLPQSFAQKFPMIDDPEIGKIQIQVVNTDHVFNRLRVFVMCYDKRSVPNSIAPMWESLPLPIEPLERPKSEINIPICQYRERGNLYSHETKLLNLHYTVPVTRKQDGQFECTNHIDAILDMRKWCLPWRN